MLKILWYEGWGALYLNGTKVMESDDSGDIYREALGRLGHFVEEDWGFMYMDENDGEFPGVWPNA